MIFSDDEIREELSKYGYENLTEEKFDDFKKQLGEYISCENNNQTSKEGTDIDKAYRTRSANEIAARHDKDKGNSGEIEAYSESENKYDKNLKSLDDSKNEDKVSIYSESANSCLESELSQERISFKVEFSDDDIREELSKYGYINVPQDALSQFKNILNLFINSEMHTKSISNNTMLDKSVEAVNKDDGLSPKHFQNNNNMDYKQNLKIHSTQDNSQLQTENRDHSNSKNDFNNNVAHVNFTEEYQKSVASSFLFDILSNQAPLLEHSGGRVKTDIKKSSRKSTFSDFKRLDECITKKEIGDDAFKFYMHSQRNRECISADDKPLSMFSNKSSKSTFGLPRKPSWLRPPQLAPNDDRPKQPDAFQRMRFYHTAWAAHKCPGENDEAGEMIRAKLQKHFVPKKERKQYIENGFKRPHEKVRQELRDSVKLKLAEYKMPKHGIYHDVAPIESCYSVAYCPMPVTSVAD